MGRKELQRTKSLLSTQAFLYLFLLKVFFLSASLVLTCQNEWAPLFTGIKRCAYLSNFWKVRPPLVIGLKKCLKPKRNSACWDIFCQGCGACFSTSCAACVLLVHVKRLSESKRNRDYWQCMLQLNPFSDNILLFVEQNNKQRTKSVEKRSTLAVEKAVYGTKFRVRFGIRGKAKQIYEPNIFQSFANEGHLIWKHFYHREEFIKQLVS